MIQSTEGVGSFGFKSPVMSQITIHVASPLLMASVSILDPISLRIADGRPENLSPCTLSHLYGENIHAA